MNSVSSESEGDEQTATQTELQTDTDTDRAVVWRIQNSTDIFLPCKKKKLIKKNRMKEK